MMGLEAMDSDSSLSSKHKRSKSDLDKIVMGGMLHHHHHKLNLEKDKGHDDTNKKPLLDAKGHSYLKQEILQLEERLKDQLKERRALEKALGFKSSAIDSSDDSLMPKTAKELIREIAVLEFEVMSLEQHLLFLYRKAFDPQVPNPASGDKSKQRQGYQLEAFQNVEKLESSSEIGTHKSFATPVSEHSAVRRHKILPGPGVYRSHSELSYRGVCSARISPSADSLARAFQSFHSQPLCFLEDDQNASSRMVSLAEHLGANIADHIPETPNKISEEMVRCMGAIYCKLSDPRVVHHGFPSCPTSSFSSMSALSPHYLADMWSPHYRREPTLDARLINPSSTEGLKEFSGPYSMMVEITILCRYSRRFANVKDMLQIYKSLVQRLEKVDPRKLKNDEKTAFWANIHNALMMHTYLVYGIPQNNANRSALLVKATCIIGGHSINLDTIRVSILRCHAQGSRQWLGTFFPTRMKTKVDEWQAYAIKHSEPLLHFVLCLGSHSDPAVRIYNSKKLPQKLEAAKREYIRASVSIRKEQKILIPKVIETYAKEAGLNSQRLVDMIQHNLPETLRTEMQRCQQGKSQKIVEWIPHNFAFRYLLSSELAIHRIN